jgi:metallo-beta-lactamase family protein
MKITFFGAAQNVTGSKHLLEVGNYKLLLDCGLYQGKRKTANELNQNLPFLAKEIDAVILSHAHLDHCGTLPVLAKNGFTGLIYCTAETAEITQFILEDSAGLQEQDADYLNNHLLKGQSAITPIYTRENVAQIISQFEKIQYFNKSQKWTVLNESIRFKFYDAGHVLGSAMILLEVKEGTETKTLVFSGDLGREFLPILKSPETITENIDSLLLECTYGDRLHKPIENLQEKLVEIINNAIVNKSKIIVPAFSLERTQEIIYILHKLCDEKLIPVLPIYIDSPLANKITQVFLNHTENFDNEFWQDFGNKKESAFSAANIIYTQSTDASKAINDTSGPCIIIAGSGMCEGGRILHHLKNNISNSNNVILITGYQAENTLGRKILEGAEYVKIYDQLFAVKAKVFTLNELSAHADQNDLLKFVGKALNLKNLFLVHGEIKQLEAFKSLVNEKFPNINIKTPVMGELFEI